MSSLSHAWLCPPACHIECHSLPPHCMQVGNSSGSSNLCLLHRELAHKRLSPGDIALPEHLMCIGIGPGLSIEAVLVKRIERTDPLAPDMSNLRMTSLLNRSARSSAMMTRPCSQDLAAKSGTKPFSVVEWAFRDLPERVISFVRFPTSFLN